VGVKKITVWVVIPVRPEEDEAALWCIQNNICITPRALKWGERIWVIDIEKGDIQIEN
jgi:hypothetical protein